MYFLEATAWIPTADDLGDAMVREVRAPSSSSAPQHLINTQLMFKDMLLEFQAEHDLPSSFIERESTRKLITGFAPGVRFKIPSTSEMEGRVLQRYIEGRSRLLSDRPHCALRLPPLDLSGSVRLSHLTVPLADFVEQIAESHRIHWDVELHNRTLLTFPLPHVGYNGPGGMLVSAAQIDDWIRRLGDNKQTIDAAVMKESIVFETTARSRRALEICWPRTVFLSCYANDLTTLVKPVLESPAFATIASSAEAIVLTLNALEDPELRLLHLAAIEATYGDVFPLFPLCEWQWASMQPCFASLLRVRLALELYQQRAGSKSPPATAPLGDYAFWEGLAAAEQIVVPLVSAAYRLYQPHPPTLADVVISFRDIYHTFRRHADHFGDAPAERVAKLWHGYEQPLYMLALFLHPVHIKGARIKVVATSVSGEERLCDFAVYYYRRFVSEDVGDLRSDMVKWMRGELTTHAVPTETQSPLVFWRAVGADHAQSKLPELAARILSIEVNTTTCEFEFHHLGSFKPFDFVVERSAPSMARDLFLVRQCIRDNTLVTELDKAEYRKPVVPREFRIDGQAGGSSSRDRKIDAKMEEHLFDELNDRASDWRDPGNYKFWCENVEDIAEADDPNGCIADMKWPLVESDPFDDYGGEERVGRSEEAKMYETF